MIKAGLHQARAELRFAFMSTVGALTVGLLLLAPAQRAYDDHVRPRPFITALVEIVPRAGDRPDVRYLAQASTKVSGSWSAWVDVDGRRGCGGAGTSGYAPTTASPRLWLWEDWLGRDCPMPNRPFALCVRYAVQTPAGVGDLAGPFCSAIFDPRGN